MEGNFCIDKLFCGYCLGNHPLNLACYDAREALDEASRCPFCNELRFSGLVANFDKDAENPLTSEYQGLIKKACRDHVCEKRAKLMVVHRHMAISGHHEICQMCIKEQLPSGPTEENTQLVECKRFVHSTSSCDRFCYYCFNAKNELNDHSWHYCTYIPKDIKKSFIMYGI